MIHKKRIPLPKPRAAHVAGQCRQMKIQVGDTIIGRETHANGSWSEVKLTLLFCGRQEAVWRVMERGSGSRRWGSYGESANWTLECRQWKKVLP